MAESHYTPYAALAEASVEPDEHFAEHLEYIGVDLTQGQLDRLTDYVNQIAEAHVKIGIDIGLELSAKNPMEAVESFNEGYREAQADMLDLREGDE